MPTELAIPRVAGDLNLQNHLPRAVETLSARVSSRLSCVSNMISFPPPFKLDTR